MIIGANWGNKCMVKQLLKFSPKLFLISSTLVFCTAQNIQAATFSNGFESGNFSLTQDGVTPGGTAGDIRPVVSENKPKDGNYSVKFTFQGDPNSTMGTGSKLQFDLNNYYRDVWVQFDVFFPSNWTPRDRDAKAHNKGPIMVWADAGWHDDLKSFSSYESWNATGWPTGTVSYNRGGSRGHRYVKLNGKYFQYPDPNNDLGRWMNIVARIKFATTENSNDGIFQLWKDGELGLSITDANNYLKNGRPGANHIYLFGPADTGFNVDTSIYLDNLVISDKPLEGYKASTPLSPPAPPTIN